MAEPNKRISSQPTPCCILLLMSASVFIEVSGHGRMNEPPNRSSLFRFQEFAYPDMPENWNDIELYCGNYTTQWEVYDGKCGVCGDTFGDPQPRANEDGGVHGRGIIVRNYTEGQVIPIEILITTNHWGYFEIRLCASDEIEDHLDESCYLKHILPVVDNSGDSYNENRYVLTTNEPNTFEYHVRLPEGVRCRHCVVQWHYWTGNKWGICDDGSGALGCGPQETFRGCADVAIF